jgi:hypothetical protein
MKYKEIPDPDGSGAYLIAWSDDIEYVNPIDEMFNGFIEAGIILEQKRISSEFPSLSPEEVKRISYQISMGFARKRMDEIFATKFPSPMQGLIENISKGKQRKLFRGLSLTTDELLSFIFYTSQKGFTFSHYKSEHDPKGFENEKAPSLIHRVNDNKIVSIGETTLTPGQQKSLINQRAVVNAKFLDRGNHWYCFFSTYRSLTGKETGETPHLHFISHSWGISREKVLQELKSKNYNLPSLPHIDYHTHRNPRNEYNIDETLII